MSQQTPCKLPESPMGCPLDSLLRLLMGQWTTYILWKLCQNGPMRFGELKRNIPGVSAKVLTERLRQLEDAGVVSRECLPTRPPQVSYRLTPRSQDLIGVLQQLNAIAQKWTQET